MYPGEYPQPLVRKTNVQCPVVSGYVTAHLLSQDYFAPALSGTGYNTNMLVTLENVGDLQFNVLLRETDDRSISGTRYTVMNAVSLVPGGQSTQLVDGRRPYLEVYCTGTTTGQLRMQLDGQRKWDVLGFAKDDPFYPPQLFQGSAVPGPTT